MCIRCAQGAGASLLQEPELRVRGSRWKSLKEILKSIATFEILEQRLHRHPLPRNTGVPCITSGSRLIACSTSSIVTHVDSEET